MKTWIVSSLDDETIQGEETIQGRELYEKIRYMFIWAVNSKSIIGYFFNLWSDKVIDKASFAQYDIDISIFWPAV